jgi:hypothetical protein
MLKLTATQKRYVLAATRTHGVILFNGPTRSAYQQDQMLARLAAAGAVVPGTSNITDEAWRAVDPAGFDAIHADALGMDEIRSEWLAEVDAEDAHRRQAKRDADHADALIENEARAHQRVADLGVRTPATNAEIAAAYADLERAADALRALPTLEDAERWMGEALL